MANNIALLTALVSLLFCIIGIYTFFAKTQSLKQVRLWETGYRLGLISIIVLSGFGCLIISNHYSVDSYNLIFDMSPYWHLQLGRYINCSEIILALQFGLNQVLQQRLFAIVWIICLIITIFIIDESFQNIFCHQSIIRKIIITLSVILAFTNVFSMEFVLFPEMMMVNILGTLSLGLSIWISLEDFSFKKRWTIALIFLLIALGNYQSYIGIFESFVLIGILFKFHTNQKRRYLELTFALFIGGIASIFNIVLVKILLYFGIIVDSGRGAALQLSIVLENIKKIINYQVNFWTNADGLLSNKIMPLLGFFLIIVFFKTERQLKRIKQLEYIVIFFIIYILSFAPHLVESRILLTPRSNLAIWSVLVACFISGTIIPSHFFTKCLTIFCGVLLSVNIFFMQDIASNTQAVNSADFVEAIQICEAISTYESQSGNKISKIATKNDIKPTVYQPFSRYKNSELGARIMITDYSNYRLIAYYLKRNLTKVDMPEEIYNNHFKDKNWDCQNLNEQLYFEDDTAYLMIY